MFERRTVDRLLDLFERVLRDVTEDPAQRLADLPRRVEGERSEGQGLLWLTDPETPAAGAVVEARETEEKAAAIQDQVAARRSKLSEKQLALLRQRLQK